MGKSKTTSFTEEQNQLAIMAKALAHPARIAILQYLMQQTNCVCGDIVDELPLAQATVSQHLKALKDAGIIQGEISGTRVCYCISPEGWKMLETYFSNFFRQFQPSGVPCC
jgi:DNA-binding transcriptional ArsR family regulator